MAENELIDQVDEHNNIIGPVIRAVAHNEGLWHRSVHIWVYSEKGNVLLQRRSLDKADAPGKLDMAIGGHLKSGQSVNDAVQSEAEEELGFTIDPSAVSEPLVFSYKRASDQMPEPHCQFVYCYFIEVDESTEFTFNDGEVSEVSWISFNEFSKILDHDDLYRDFAFHSDTYFKRIISNLNQLIKNG